MARLLSQLDKPLGLTTVGISLAYVAAFIPYANSTWAYVFFSAALGSALVALSIIDIATHRLPNSITLPLVVLGLAGSTVLELQPGIAARGIAAALAYGLLWTIAVLYRRLRGRAGLGLGDAKLFAAAAAWVGPQGLPAVLLFAAVTALGTALALILSGRMTFSSRLPFGPFLAAALWLVWLYGPPL